MPLDALDEKMRLECVPKNWCTVTPIPSYFACHQVTGFEWWTTVFQELHGVIPTNDQLTSQPAQLSTKYPVDILASLSTNSELASLLLNFQKLISGVIPHFRTSVLKFNNGHPAFMKD
jgi:hypothetical protein